MKNAPKKLYTEILLWVYEKGPNGFTKNELKTSLAISDDQWPWVDYMIFEGPNGADRLVWSIPGSSEYGIRFYPTSSGAGAAVDYLELQEAQKNSKTAFWTAIIAIAISILVGALQILLPQNINSIKKIESGKIQTEVTNLPSLQDVNIKNDTVNTRVTNWPK